MLSNIYLPETHYSCDGREGWLKAALKFGKIDKRGKSVLA